MGSVCSRASLAPMDTTHLEHLERTIGSPNVEGHLSLYSETRSTSSGKSVGRPPNEFPSTELLPSEAMFSESSSADGSRRPYPPLLQRDASYRSSARSSRSGLTTFFEDQPADESSFHSSVSHSRPAVAGVGGRAEFNPGSATSIEEIALGGSSAASIASPGDLASTRPLRRYSLNEQSSVSLLSMTSGGPESDKGSRRPRRNSASSPAGSHSRLARRASLNAMSRSELEASIEVLNG